MAQAKASGTVVLYGEPEATIPAGTLLQRGDGVQFKTRDEVRLNEAGEELVEVYALKGGPAGNTPSGSTLTIVGRAPEGVEADGIVSVDGITIAGSAEPAAAVKANPAASTVEVGSATTPGATEKVTREVLVHFVTAGPTFHDKVGQVEADWGAGVIDVRVHLSEDRFCLLERVPARGHEMPVGYPSWEEIAA